MTIDRKKYKLVNCSFSNSGIVDSFNEEVNLSLRDKIKVSKASLDSKFKKSINNFIDELNSLSDEEINSNIDIILKTYSDDIIRSIIIDVINNSQDKNLYTTLKLESYNLLLEDISELQVRINSLGSVINYDSLINDFANKILFYITNKLPLYKANLFKDRRL